MHRVYRRVRRLPIFALLCGGLLNGILGGCLDSDLLRRFRDGYAPGFVEGFTTAVLTPGDWEVGLRRTWAALFEGLGAIIQPLSNGSSGGNTRR